MTTVLGRKSVAGPGPWKQALTQYTWASGASAAVEVDIQVAGTIRTAICVANNSTNAITYQLEFYDENDAQLLDQSGIAKNASTGITGIDTFFYGTLTVKVTPSGDPGASGGTFDVVLMGD